MHTQEIKEEIKEEVFNSDLEKMQECKPVNIVANPDYNPRLTPIKRVANLSDSSMISYYRGCGDGYAFIKDNKVVAFYYHEGVTPSNEPKDAEKIRVKFSCTQICFFK